MSFITLTGENTMRMVSRAQLLSGLILLAITCVMSATGVAAVPQNDGRAMVQQMADAVVATLRAGADQTARQARFRKMYRRYFDRLGVAASVLGRPYQQAMQPQKAEILRALEQYIVAVYAAKLGDYAGERLIVLGSEEPEGNGLIVTSQIVGRNSGAARLEVKWRLVLIDGQLKVRDVLIQGVSMVLTMRREFAELLPQEKPGMADIVAAMRQKAAEFDRK